MRLIASRMSVEIAAIAAVLICNSLPSRSNRIMGYSRTFPIPRLQFDKDKALNEHRKTLELVAFKRSTLCQ